MVAVFIYNVLLIILFAFTMSFAFNHYLKERRRFFLILTVYLAFFILDNVIIYMTEFFNTFANSYNETFMSVPVVKTLIFIVNNLCSLWLITELAEEKIKPLHYVMLIAVSVWMMAVPMMDNSAFKVWLYYLPNQLFLIYLGGYAWHNYKLKKQLSQQILRYLKWIAIICVVFGVFILIEDSFVIFNVDQYTSLSIKIYNRNFNEDIFSIIVCLVALHYFIRSANGKRQKQSEEQQLESFCLAHQITQREAEILRMLLDYRQNQEIADALFLSIGTVKTHVHNIYVKLNIQKRNQIHVAYQQFVEAPPDKAADNS